MLNVSGCDVDASLGDVTARGDATPRGARGADTPQDGDAGPLTSRREVGEPNGGGSEGEHGWADGDGPGLAAEVVMTPRGAAGFQLTSRGTPSVAAYGVPAAHDARP